MSRAYKRLGVRLVVVMSLSRAVAALVITAAAFITTVTPCKH